jgi:pimeloyl-ACP methyl ester carboxylesterase
MHLTRKTILVNGWPVHYSTAGQGEPAVLIHGLSESTAVWRRNIAALARRYCVYLLDLPGFGAMRKFHRQFNLQESASWLADWMEAVELESAFLVGHSMGGYPSMALAATHPEKVKGLVLVDSIGIPFGDLASRQVYLALKSIVRTTPAFWPYIAYDYIRAGPAMVRRATLQIYRLDATSTLAAVAVPTLLIWGEKDDLVPLSLGQQLQKRLAGSRLLVISGANHFCMFEHPAAFHNALFRFFEGQEVGKEAEESLYG